MVGEGGEGGGEATGGGGSAACGCTRSDRKRAALPFRPPPLTDREVTFSTYSLDGGFSNGGVGGGLV